MRLTYLISLIPWSDPSNCWHPVLCAWAQSGWEIHGGYGSLQRTRQADWRKYWCHLPPRVSCTSTTNTHGLGVSSTGGASFISINMKSYVINTKLLLNQCWELLGDKPAKLFLCFHSHPLSPRLSNAPRSIFQSKPESSKFIEIVTRFHSDWIIELIAWISMGNEKSWHGCSLYEL